MNKIELREKLTSVLKTVCDNVETTFEFPEEKTSLQSDFPYITIIFGKMELLGGTKRGLQNISLLGFVKGKNEDLRYLIEAFEGKLFSALYRNEKIKLVINEIDGSNLFKPFGLDAGIYPPYAGVRFEIAIPEIKVI